MKYKVFDLTDGSAINKLSPRGSVINVGLEEIINYFADKGYELIQIYDDKLILKEEK